jgi:hypothetical protein
MPWARTKISEYPASFWIVIIMACSKNEINFGYLLTGQPIDESNIYDSPDQSAPFYA